MSVRGGTQPGGEQAHAETIREALNYAVLRLECPDDAAAAADAALDGLVAALAAAEARADAGDRLAKVAEDYLRDEYPAGTSHPSDWEAARLERAVAEYRALAGSPVGPQVGTERPPESVFREMRALHGIPEPVGPPPAPPARKET